MPRENEDRMRNRRRAPRIDGTHWMAIRLLPVPGLEKLSKKVFFCSTRDLSHSGVRLVVGASMPVGARTELRLGIAQPSATFLHVGTVRWVKDAGGAHEFELGIEFTDSSPAVLEAWLKFVNQQLAGQRPSGKPAKPAKYAADPDSAW